MPRVKINFPQKTHFLTEYVVTTSDLNYGNHVGNDSFLSFCHEARVRFIKSLGQDELDFFGTSLIMSDAELSYKGQSYYGDLLKIEVSALESSTKSFDLFYRIKNQKEELILLAKTGMVYFDYTEKKIESSPAQWSLELNKL